MKNTNLKDNEGSGSEQSDLSKKHQPEHIEDVPDTEPTIPLSDEQLEHAGLIKVTTFIRSKKSEEAARKEKQRKKEEQEGLKQLNLKANIEHHEFLKQLASELKTATAEQTKTIQDMLGNLKAATTVTQPIPPLPIQPVSPVTSHKIVTGWRKFALSFLSRLINLLDK